MYKFYCLPRTTYVLQKIKIVKKNLHLKLYNKMQLNFYIKISQNFSKFHHFGK